MKLPNGERAKLGAKLEEYSLNPRHRLGQHKARIFETALGINLANREILAAALLAARRTPMRPKAGATMVSEKPSSCGSR